MDQPGINNTAAVPCRNVKAGAWVPRKYLKWKWLNKTCRLPSSITSSVAGKFKHDSFVSGEWGSDSKSCCLVTYSLLRDEFAGTQHIESENCVSKYLTLDTELRQRHCIN
ncbi:hypothetical protein FOPG_05880 [Fusarium oxysporum f. sp. conglutinans race 2 54008]|uniref:Uncharacterized protein n=1 Tax=Fusarium oxysporum f. sp. conglutinans race 2 54008 TaxID=1089457 RepID=X0I9A8_FUSOX|nr:hypothetical protein FOPG_05880 [Fusarium oxysporum f. sp. conglutinans race 2 54008]KAI8419075.1 hypothetical protein FOFC_01648 [Fusarium oxysporum]